jgi:NAD(P)-dependent dehydrogenase (short-subunit alcohol dehydrogenase family)
MERKLVVTGTSTGIGHAIALRAARDGWSVLATARDPAAGHTGPAAAELAAAGCTVTRLDLRDEDTIAEFAATAEAWCEGRLDALVNNAGTALPGAVEELSIAEIREQFEVNVFGHVAVTQRLLPALRRAAGRVVFVSSDRARVPIPLYGAYCGSKAALEGFAGALAAEVEGFGVMVSVLELGSYRSAIRGPIRERLEQVAPDSPYANATRGSLGRLGSPPLGDPAEVAAATLDLLEASKPPARAEVGPKP